MLSAAYGGKTASNPKYIAAVQLQQAKQKERELQSLQSNPLTRELVRELYSLRQQVAFHKMKDEERWHDEFQANIKRLRFEIEIHGINMDPEMERAANRVISEVAEAHGYTLTHMYMKCRAKKFVLAKREAICEVYERFPKLSLPQIGSLFNLLDHTSVLYHVKKAGRHSMQRSTRPFPTKKAA